MAQREVISVSMAPDLVDHVDELAHQARMNRSEFIRKLIEEQENAEVVA